MLPGIDSGLVPAKEYLGHTPAVVHRRTGVNRRFEKIILERIGEGALLVADSTGQQTHDGIGDYRRGHLSAGKHIIPHRNLAGDEVFAYSVVDALVR